MKLKDLVNVLKSAYVNYFFPGQLSSHYQSCQDAKRNTVCFIATEQGPSFEGWGGRGRWEAWWGWGTKAQVPQGSEPQGSLGTSGPAPRDIDAWPGSGQGGQSQAETPTGPSEPTTGYQRASSSCHFQEV